MGKRFTFHAPDHVLEKFPEGFSGNSQNGVGEKQARRPKPLIWHMPGITPTVELREYVLENFFSIPELVKAFWEPDDGRGPEPNAKCSIKGQGTSEEWTQRIKDFALAHGADDVGITPVIPGEIFEGFSCPFPNLIVFAVKHDYELLAAAPSNPYDNTHAAELGTQYARAARVAAEIGNFIHDQGFDRELYLGPDAHAINFLPHAIAAGMGELGKHGSLIHPRFGSGFRLSAVATDMPLAFDEPLDFGADDFCSTCQVCFNECPPDAISNEKKVVRGVEKWSVDFDKCIPYFNETMGCGICIAVCPWTRPGVADNLVVKMARRRARQEEKDNAVANPNATVQDA
ncbi:MAG: reductive dehalogenase domain-containing protein [Pseudomonadota bacterium]